MRKLITDEIQNYNGSFVEGSWDHLATYTPSGVATQNVESIITTHVMYKFFWTDLETSSDGDTFGLRTSTNNGGAYDSGTSDYEWAWHLISMAVTPAHASIGSAANDYIRIWDSVGNATNETNWCEISLINPSDTEYTKFHYKGIVGLSTGAAASADGAGQRVSAADVDAVQFFFTTGNITGTLNVYGLNAS